MTHRIGKGEDIAAGILRLIGEDLDEIVADLDGAGNGDGDNGSSGGSGNGAAEAEARVHRVRQRLKRTRAALRVLEPHFGRVARKARRRLAKAARLLSAARDADVVAAAASAIGFDGKVTKALDAEAAEAHRATTDLARPRAIVARVAGTVAAMDRDFDGATLLARALEHGYRRGRHAMARARATRATDDLHRWRKETKRLFHLMRLSRRRLPPAARTVAGRLDRIGGALGLDHDHAILADRLTALQGEGAALKQQLALVTRRRAALQDTAFRLGRRVYGKPPRTFREMIRVDRSARKRRKAKRG